MEPRAKIAADAHEHEDLSSLWRANSSRRIGGQLSACLVALAISTTVGGESAKVQSATGPQRFFGDYEILGELARGGMGVVYRARQASLNRPVALKMIATGQLATPVQMQRFHLEAEAAARLDHPNIVPIYEIGEHQGQHFYSMKLIEGGSLARFASGFRVPGSEWNEAGKPNELGSKLATLIACIARAVQYAHQRGVLHRDLKPTNILIDARDQPHIADFGLAKLFEEDSTLTQTAAILGTPAYMAPEMASGKAAEATTAADVYSLGAILYELLCGQPPFVAETVPALLRKIVEEEPVRPSVICKSQLERNFKSEIQNPKSEIETSPPTLAVPTKVDRDLEVICLKCLEKEPAKRYASAAALAEELERWLRDEPIHARPATPAEKFRSWCRRKPALAGVSFALAVAVLGGLVVTNLLLLREKQARYRALAAEHEQSQLRARAEAEKETAKTEAAKSRQLAAFLRRTLRSVGPTAALGRDTALLRDLLDEAAGRIDQELTNQPAVEAELRDTIGRAYFDVGQYEKAASMQREALRLRREVLNSEPSELGQSLHAMAGALAAGGHLDEAEALNREEVALWKTMFDENDPKIAGSLNNLGDIAFRRRDWAQARRYFEEALSIYRKHTGSELHAGLHNLANALAMQSDLAGAEKLHREAIDLFRKEHSGAHPTTALYLYNLGEVLRAQGKLREAETFLAESLAMRAGLLDERHPWLSDSLEKLAQLKYQQKQWKEAEDLYRKALSARRKQWPKDPSKWVDDANHMAELLNNSQHFEQTDGLLTDLLAATSNTDPRTAPLWEIRSRSRARHGQWREALPDMARAFDLEPANHWYSLWLAPLLVESGDPAAYEAFCRRCLAQFAGATHPDIATRMAQACLLAPSAEADLPAVEKLLGSAMAYPGYASLGYATALKALAEYRSGRPADAIRRSVELIAQVSDEKLKAGRFVKIQARAVLAMAEHALGHREAARTALDRALDVAPDKIETPKNGDYGPGWYEWLILQIHLREARTLIEGNDKAAKP